MYSKRTLLLSLCASIAVGAETPLLQWEGRSNRQDTLLWISDATEKLFINSKGYPFARIEFVAFLDHQENQWLWEQYYFEGERTLIAPLKNRGQSKTTDHTLEKMAHRPAGKEWNIDELERIERRLLRTGYFIPRAPSFWKKDPKRQLLHPIVTLDDAPTRRIEFQLEGDDSQKMPSGNLLVDWRNLSGTARDLMVSYRSLQENQNEALFRYKEPWLFNGPSLWLQTGLERIDTLYSRIRGEAGLEWQGDLLTFALYVGKEQVAERDEESILENREAQWGRTRLEIDRRQWRIQGTGDPLLPQGNLYSLEGWLLSPDQGEKWMKWSGECQGRARYLETPFSLLHRVKFAGRTPWKAGITREGLYFWGGANTLRGFREGELRSLGWALASLQPEWRVTRRWSLFSFVDGALDWMPSEPNSPVHRWGWGGGAQWNTETIRVGLSLTWPGVLPSRDAALLLLSWDNRF